MDFIRKALDKIRANGAGPLLPRIDRGVALDDDRDVSPLTRAQLQEFAETGLVRIAEELRAANVSPPRDVSGAPIIAAEPVNVSEMRESRDVFRAPVGCTVEPIPADAPVSARETRESRPVETEPESLTLSIEIDEESRERLLRVCEEFQDKIEEAIDGAIEIVTAPRILHEATSPEVEERIAKAYVQGLEEGRAECGAGTDAGCTHVEAALEHGLQLGRKEGHAAAVEMELAPGLDPAGTERLGLLVAAAGELSKAVGRALSEGLDGGTTCDGWIVRPVRMDIDDALDDLFAASTIMRQENDLPSVDIAARGRRITQMRDDSKLNQSQGEGAA